MDALYALAQPWADLYNGSTPLQTAVIFLHFAGLLLAGGLAIAADRAIVRTARRPAEAREHVLADVNGMHRLVLFGLAAIVATGLLMFLADLEPLAGAWLFWLKMTLFGLLLVNGRMLQLYGRRATASEAAWMPLRAAAIRSSALWFAVMFVGTLLPIVA